MSGDAILTLTGCIQVTERKIAHALHIDPDRVCVIADDDAPSPQWTLIVYASGDESGAADHIARTINALIASGEAAEWLGPSATCSVAAEEEDVFIDEAEALRLWREASDRTSHLDAVLNPDGQLVMPRHDGDEEEEPMSSIAEDWVSATEAQLLRDPTLLDFDNVQRVDTTLLHTASWNGFLLSTEPFVISSVALRNDDDDVLSRAQLVARFGDAEVRTGNRNTLIDNGFVNSKPMALRDALSSVGDAATDGVERRRRGDLECSRMVFSPVKELPEDFRDHLAPLTSVFPCEHEVQGRERVRKKFTLCLANEGFGIGFHSHNAAMFLLLVGSKKWYMGPPSTAADTPTHPGFYTTKSSHKCIQQPGEILYVPNGWFHEIFNLSPHTAGLQALPV